MLPAEPIRSVDDYLATEWGGVALQRAAEMGPDGVIEELRRSGLRGRGGAGFPTGRKWAGVASQSGTHRYVVANGAEGEPATFKDRALMRANPYQVVEGLVLAAFAVGAREAFLALKASFTEELDAVTRAVQELQQAGICGECVVTIVRGPDEYLFGEEKALLEVIEGNAPLPRILPPYEHGLFATAPQTGWQAHDPEPGHTGRHESNPTLVNNVETLANAAAIVARGADWFRSMGTDESPGTLICTVVGDVAREGVAEIELGTPLRDVITTIGGDERGSGTSQIKAVFSGIANAVITAANLDVPLSYEGFEAIGSGLGAGGFLVLDGSACMVEAALRLSRFLYVESCGQCPPCKLGSGEITACLERIEAGTPGEHDVASMTGWLSRVTDGNRCYLAVQEQVVVSSVLRAFPEEFEEHLAAGGCPRPRPERLVVPKLLDLRDGHAVYDDRQVRKRPDWTYDPEA